MKKHSSTLYVLLSAIFFSTGGLFFKLASWNSLAINSARSLIGFVVVTIYLIIIKHKLIINKTVLFSAFAVASTSLLYSMANKMTTAGNTIVLQFTMPVFVILLSVLFYNKKPTKLEITTCIFVFFGIVIFFIDSLNAGNMIGNILATISGLAYALYFIFNNNKDADSISSVCLGLFICFLVGLPDLLKTDIVNSSKETLFAVICLGVFQLGFGHIFLAKGFKETTPVVASLLSGLEPILNPILVAIFCKEMLTPLSMIGAFIVLSSIISYNVITSKKKLNSH